MESLEKLIVCVNKVDVLYELDAMFFLWMTKVSSTYLTHNIHRWLAELMALVSNSSMNRLATVGLMGDPMAAP